MGLPYGRRSQAANPKAKTKAINAKVRWRRPTTSSKAFAFKTKVTFHNMPKVKHVKGYFAML